MKFQSAYEAYTFLLIAQQEITELVSQNEKKLASFLSLLKDDSLPQRSIFALSELEQFARLSEQIKNQAVELDDMVQTATKLVRHTYFDKKNEANL